MGRPLPRDVLAKLADRRLKKRLAADPDTLHGVLLLDEQEADRSQLAAAVNMQPATLRTLLGMARAGDADRVPAAYGSRALGEQTNCERHKALNAARRRTERRQLQ